MNLEKLYQETGGDMAGAVRRLGSIAAVERFLRMFAGDDTFAMLQAAISAGDGQRAFRAAHTLKGLAANLGLVQLGQAASALTEALRGGDMQRASALIAFPLRLDSFTTSPSRISITICIRTTSSRFASAPIAVRAAFKRGT